MRIVYYGYINEAKYCVLILTKYLDDYSNGRNLKNIFALTDGQISLFMQ